AKKRPSRMATASASGFCRSSVVIRPLNRTRSAVAVIQSASQTKPASPVLLRLGAFVRAEHGARVDDAEAIGAAVSLGDAGRKLVGLGATPVALQLEQIL